MSAGTTPPEINMEEDEQLQQFVSSMPKIELHAHLNGCIREATLFELAKERGAELSTHHFGPPPTANGASVYSYSFMYNIQPRSLEDCFEMFAEIPKCVDDKPSLERITREALDDFAQHHVVYLELRSTPKILKGMSKKDYIETVLAVLKDFEMEEEARYQRGLGRVKASSKLRLPMSIRFIVSIDRSVSPKEADENVSLAIEFFQKPGSLVVGVDVGGNPTKNDFRDFQGALTTARNAGLKVTAHCGEVPVGESELEEHPKLRKSFQEVSAVLKFRPDRVGHALLLPASLRDDLCELRIPVESCPTSNVMTLELAKHVGGNLIHGLQQHPQLKYWLQNNYPISISTDDPGVFNTNATQELLLLCRSWQVSQQQLQTIVVGSLEHAFCSNDVKDRIRERMQSFFSA